MKRRLLETEMLRDDHFLIVAFFNAISDSKFVRMVELMSLGIGMGSNETVCAFPDDLDADEETFDGVMFSLSNEEIVVDYPHS